MGNTCSKKASKAVVATAVVDHTISDMVKKYDHCLDGNNVYPFEREPWFTIRGLEIIKASPQRMTLKQCRLHKVLRESKYTSLSVQFYLAEHFGIRHAERPPTVSHEAWEVILDLCAKQMFKELLSAANTDDIIVDLD